MVKDEAYRGGRHLVFPCKDSVGKTVAIKFFSQMDLFRHERDILKQIESRVSADTLEKGAIEERRKYAC